MIFVVGCRRRSVMGWRQERRFGFDAQGRIGKVGFGWVVLLP